VTKVEKNRADQATTRARMFLLLLLARWQGFNPGGRTAEIPNYWVPRLESIGCLPDLGTTARVAVPLGELIVLEARGHKSGVPAPIVAGLLFQ
jgi:hypothetical protein